MTTFYEGDTFASTTALAFTARNRPDPDIPRFQPSGTLQLNKRYQRAGISTLGRTYTGSAVRFRAVMRNNQNNFTDNNVFFNIPNPTATNNRRIPNSGWQNFIVGAQNFNTAVRPEVKVKSGRNVSDWLVAEGPTPLSFYTPALTTFNVSTFDGVAASAGYARTRVDREATLNYQTNGFRQDDGDPGDVATNVFLWNQTTPSFGYHPFNQWGVLLGAQTSYQGAIEANYDVFRRNNGTLTGFRTNEALRVTVGPEYTFNGAVATSAAAAPQNFYFTTGYKGVRSTQHFDAVDRGTAYGISSILFQVWPRASGTFAVTGLPQAIAFQQYGSVIYDQQTFSSAQTTVTATISNQYPDSFALMMVSPESEATPPVQLADNYPSGSGTVTGDLAGYLRGKPSGFYWISLLGYTPVDRLSFGDLIVNTVTPTFGARRLQEQSLRRREAECGPRLHVAVRFPTAGSVSAR